MYKKRRENGAGGGTKSDKTKQPDFMKSFMKNFVKERKIV